MQLMNGTTPTIIPSEDKLRLLLANGASDVAQQLIQSYKLPYIIKDGQLHDSVVGAELWLQKFITDDPETISMKDDAKKLAKCPDEVLIYGETGTGKEIIA